MNDVETRVRRAFHDAALAPADEVDLLPAIHSAMRVRRRRSLQAKGAAAVAAAVAAVGGTVLAISDDGNRGRDLGTSGSAAPTSDCTAVTIAGVGTETEIGADGVRGLAVELSNASETGACFMGPDTVLAVRSETTAASTSFDGYPTTSIAGGKSVIILLRWSNWCGDDPQTVSLAFSDGSRAASSMSSDTALPSCEDSSAEVGLAVTAVRTDVAQAGPAQH